MELPELSISERTSERKPRVTRRACELGAGQDRAGHHCQLMRRGKTGRQREALGVIEEVVQARQGAVQAGR